MTWIFLATGAQLILAVVALLDKYIVTDKKVFPRPFVYAFYTCFIAGAWAVVFILGLFPISFFGFAMPSFANVVTPTLEVVALSILAAYAFFIALVSMFTALQQADASDVVPVIGAVSAIGSFGLGYYFLGTELPPSFIWGIAFLATGTFLVSRYRFPTKVAMTALHAGLFFALHWIAIKGLFDVTTFDNGFFWSRIGFVFLALSLLLVPSYFAKIKEQTASAGRRAGYLIVGTKLLAGVASILILKATELGEVEVVQALGGTQYVFLLLLGIIFAKKMPKTCGEGDCREPSVIQKAIFVSIITLGFIMLFR